MREYAKIMTRLWSNQRFRAMGEDARLLYLYLVTTPHGSPTGLYFLPLGYVSGDLQWTEDRTRIALRDLLGEPLQERFHEPAPFPSPRGLVEYDDALSLVLIHKHLLNTPLPDPSAVKTAIRALKGTPGLSSLHRILLDEVRRHQGIGERKRAVYQPLIEFLERMEHVAQLPRPGDR